MIPRMDSPLLIATILGAILSTIGGGGLAAAACGPGISATTGKMAFGVAGCLVDPMMDARMTTTIGEDVGAVTTPSRRTPSRMMFRRLTVRIARRSLTYSSRSEGTTAGEAE
jgi:hypothetical protein